MSIKRTGLWQCYNPNAKWDKPESSAFCIDANSAIRSWFERFPSNRCRDLRITGGWSEDVGHNTDGTENFIYLREPTSSPHFVMSRIEAKQTANTTTR